MLLLLPLPAGVRAVLMVRAAAVGAAVCCTVSFMCWQLLKI
jgi:hypothetical protein